MSRQPSPCVGGHRESQVTTNRLSLLLLARKAPLVALLWSAKKNHPLSPDQVTALSGRRAHWKCGDCLHEWQAAVYLKARCNTGCPECAKAHGCRPANRARQQQPSFAKAKHALLEQWDHDRNRDNGNILAIQHYRATSSFGGAAMHVQRARSTAGRLLHTVELLAELRQDAHFALVIKFASATHWRLFVLMLLLTLMLNRTVSVLLKSQD